MTRTRRRRSSAISARPTAPAAAEAAARRLRLPPYPASSASRPTGPPTRVDVDPDGRLRGEAAAAARRGVRPACPCSTASSASRRDPACEDVACTRAGAGPPVDEATQADYYRRAIDLAACQKGVAGLLPLPLARRARLTGFQSGVDYVDGTPKTSLAPVREAVSQGAASGASALGPREAAPLGLRAMSIRFRGCSSCAN